MHCGGSALLLLPRRPERVRQPIAFERVAEHGVALLEDVVRAVDHHAARREDDLADVVEQQSETGVSLLEDLAHVRLGVCRVVVLDRPAPVPVIEADGSSERQFVSTRLKCTMSATGFPALSNVVIPRTSIDPSHTSSNPPHGAEPEYVNESVNRSGGFRGGGTGEQQRNAAGRG